MVVRPRFLLSLAAALVLWLACGGDGITAPPVVLPPEPPADTTTPPEPPPPPPDTVTPPVDTVTPPPADTTTPPELIDSLRSVLIWPDSVAFEIDSLGARRLVYPVLGDSTVQFCLFVEYRSGYEPTTNSFGIPVCDSVFGTLPPRGTRWF